MAAAAGGAHGAVMPAPTLRDKALLMTHVQHRALTAELERLRDGAPATADDDLDRHARALELELALRRAVVAHPGERGYALVAVGTAVEVDDGRRTSRYRVVLDGEAADRDAARPVSADSPVGAALLGRAVGETAVVALPDGRERRLRVLAIDDPAEAA